jgi:hypothetical protein
MGNRAEPAESAVQRVVLEALDERSEACFVSSLLSTTRSRGLDNLEAEAALASLARRGRVLVQDNYCADPHLAGVDLRVVAAVEGDGEAVAAERLVRTWNRWLRDFLANHRCG